MIEIITDSTCDLTPAQMKELGVRVLALTVQFGEELDFSRPLALGHTDCVEALDAVAEGFSDLAPKFASVFSCEIGAVVGTHAGPGAAGVAYFVK